MDDNPKLSRRSALRAAALWAGAALAASIVPSKEALAQKASKAAVKYQDKPNGDQQCSNCTHFTAPSTCAIVEGAVAAQGYCIAWVKKA